MRHWRSAVGVLLAGSLVVVAEVGGVAEAVLLVEGRGSLLRTDGLLLGGHHGVYSFILAHSQSTFLQVHRLRHVSSWLNALRLTVGAFASV